MSAPTLAHPSAGGPRAVWRLLTFVGLAVAGSIVASALLGAVGAALGLSTAARAEMVFLALCLALLAAHAICLRVIDRREWDAVRLGRDAARPGRVGAGLAVGALAIAVPTAALLAVGWLDVERAPPGSWWGAAARLSLFLAPAALWEELAFRGYAFTVLEEWAGRAAAVAATSLLFGLVHLANPGASARSTVIVALAGVFLGVVMLATRSLYAAWAAHWAFNWMQAVAFHAAVSGSGFPTPDYRMVDAGPDWATGGAWGPEGGLGAALGMTAGALLLARRGAGRGTISRGPGQRREENTT